jgi:hypothetical protein
MKNALTDTKNTVKTISCRKTNSILIKIKVENQNEEGNREA